MLAAARNNKTAAVRLMLDAGWPPDAQEAQGTTALHWAGFHGNVEMARALLNRGARVDVKEREHGGTPIDWAEHGAVHSVRDAGVGTRTVPVPCVALAGHLERHGVGRVHLLKLDVEGNEAEAIEGLGPRLADVDVIVGEMHERLVDAPALYARLEAAGFRVLAKKAFGDGAAEGVHAFEMARAAPSVT